MTLSGDVALFLEYAKKKKKSEISSLSSSLKISDIFKATFLVKCIAASDNVTLEGVKAFAILTRPEVFFSFLFFSFFVSALYVPSKMLKGLARVRRF